MEKFIIYSKEYRDNYIQFTNYLHGIGYSKASCITFDTSIREFLSWLEKQQRSVEQVKEQDIENFYSHLQDRPNKTIGGTLSESRVVLSMYAIRLFFQHLQDIEQVEVNPMGNLAYTREFKRTRENLLSVEDIQKLYDECPTAKQRAMLGIIYGCGLRRQEAVKLDIKDLHFRNQLLYVREGKGRTKRTIPLSTTVLNDLKEYYYHQRPTELNANTTNAFMLNSKGRRMQGETYSEEIKKLVIKAKLNGLISLHYFRHAIATHLLESGMKTEHVKDFLGHRSIETTQGYTHITPAQMKNTTAYGITNLPTGTLY